MLIQFVHTVAPPFPEHLGVCVCLFVCLFVCVSVCVMVCDCASSFQIVTMVDFLLKTRDLNQDGLLAPSELLSSPLPYIQVHVYTQFTLRYTFIHILLPRTYLYTAYS